MPALKKKKPNRAAKRKKSAIPIEQLEEMAKAEVAELRLLADRRGRMAKRAYAEQDKATQEILDAIRDRLLIGANGLIRIQPPNAQQGDVFAVEMGMKYIEQNALFLATEILKDFALFDIRVENYKFPRNRCADCGRKLK
jgi:hypothetical protein